MNYFEDLEIDKNSLDEAILKQHILNMKYHELYANKSYELNEQRRQVKLLDTEVKSTYSSLFLNYKITKKIDGKTISDKVSEHYVLIDSEYKKVQQKYFNGLKKQNELQKEFEILDGVVRSFQQRKNDLEKAIELHISGYHGQVRQNNQKETVEKWHKKINNI